MAKDIYEIFLNGFDQKKETIIKPVNSAIDNIIHKNGIIHILRSIVPDFEIDNFNKEVIAKLFNYFIGNESFCNENGINLNKGIILCGGVGTGKTKLFEAFKLYTSEINKINGFQSFTASEIIDSVNIHGVAALEKFNNSVHSRKSAPITCYVDDISSQLESVKNYGTEISVMDQFISMRYNVYQRYKKLTHFSTNLYPVDMEKNYDPRIIDRLIEMCNVIELPGKSRRK